MHESSEMRMLRWMTRAETLGNISKEKHKSRCGKHRGGGGVEKRDWDG